MSGQRVEESLRNPIGIGVKEAHPEKVFDRSKLLKENGQAVAQTDVLAIRSGVLADQGNLAHSRRGQVFRFPDDGFKAPAAKGAAQLRDDAERAGVVAAFGDLDVSLMLGRGDDARREVVIKKGRRLRGQDAKVA